MNIFKNAILYSLTLVGISILSNGISKGRKQHFLHNVGSKLTFQRPSKIHPTAETFNSKLGA
ncbi:MAG: hypothetical protein M3512_07075, partial [Bacteroidota bacterium]|nr:hypothetical protein [Bacteroidota bacterium]